MRLLHRARPRPEAEHTCAGGRASGGEQVQSPRGGNTEKGLDKGNDGAQIGRQRGLGAAELQEEKAAGR